MLSLVVYLVMLLPSSGVVSGGREFLFDTTEGLIPHTSWLYAQPFHPYDKSTFTELTCQEGYLKAFTVASSGETAGLVPYLSSRVYSDGYSAAFFLEDFSAFAIRDSTNFSYSAYYSSFFIDFRKTDFHSPHMALQYLSENFLLAGADQRATAAFKYPFSDFFSVGPAVMLNNGYLQPWLLADFDISFFSLSVFPAIDAERVYRRVFTTCSMDSFSFSSGWNGEEYCDNISYTNENFITNLSSSPLGIMIVFQPINSLLFVTSLNENNHCSAEIQTEFHNILSGVSIFHTPQDGFKIAMNVGINLNVNTIQNSLFSKEGWWSKPATIR